MIKCNIVPENRGKIKLFFDLCTMAMMPSNCPQAATLTSCPNFEENNYNSE